jgi:hypothetical protein
LFVAGDFGFESGSKKTRQWDNTGQFFGLLAGPKDKIDCHGRILIETGVERERKPMS